MRVPETNFHRIFRNLPGINDMGGSTRNDLGLPRTAIPTTDVGLLNDPLVEEIPELTDCGSHLFHSRAPKSQDETWGRGPAYKSG